MVDKRLRSSEVISVLCSPEFSVTPAFSALTVMEISALPTFSAILGTVRLSPGWTTMPVTVQVSKPERLIRKV